MDVDISQNAAAAGQRHRGGRASGWAEFRITGEVHHGIGIEDRMVEMTRRIGGRGFYYRCVDGFISLNEMGDLTYVSFIDGKPEGVETHFDWISRPAWSAAALGSTWIVVRNRGRIQRYDLKLK